MAKVLVYSVPPSFRRAGITFTRDGVVVDSNDLTGEQQAAIASEPMLRLQPAPGDTSDQDDDRDGVSNANDTDADDDGRFESRTNTPEKSGPRSKEHQVVDDGAPTTEDSAGRVATASVEAVRPAVGDTVDGGKGKPKGNRKGSRSQ